MGAVERSQRQIEAARHFPGLPGVSANDGSRLNVNFSILPVNLNGTS
jgi:hypothetical protein